MEDLSIPKSVIRNNNKLLPDSIRACIVGKSGCGKTNLMMNLLLNDYLDNDKLYIFYKSLHQPEYQKLIQGFENKIPKHLISELIKTKLSDHMTKIGNGLSNIEIEYDSDCTTIPDPNELDSNKKNLIIFDDIMLQKQNKCEDYYTRGRHNNVDCFYISQNYTKLPRNTVRENSNLFILFPQDSITLDNFHRDHCSDINKNEFKDMCKHIWNDYITL